jgi:4'-phosphopantetheinyl transferase EntD
VCHDQELVDLPPTEPHEMLIFSAKESVFKAVFPMTGQWLDFLDVTVMVDTGAGTFRATSNTSGLDSWLIAAIEGRFCVTASFIHTAAVVSSTQRPNLDHETTWQHDDRERFDVR